MQDSDYSKNLTRAVLWTFSLILHSSGLLYCEELQRIEERISALHQVAPTLTNLEDAEQKALARLYLQKGDILMGKKSHLKAASSYRKARVLDPELPSVDLSIGIAYADGNRLALAKRFLKQFYEENQEPTLKFQCEQKLYQVLVNLGEENAKISLWDRAINSYHEAMEYSSSTRLTLDLIDRIQTAYFKQGTFHYSQKHYLEASRNFLKALSKNTRESLRSKIERIAGHLFLNAGKHYEKMGQLTEAKPYYRAVVEYFHENKVVQYAKKRLESLESQILEERSEIPAWLKVE